MKEKSSKAIIDRMSQIRLLPLVTISDLEQVLPLCSALCSGEVPIIEIAFRSSLAEKAIAMASQETEITVGAGTVLSVEQAKEAVNAGADFIVSPCLIPQLVEYCIDKDIPVFPGVSTPTETHQALTLGLSILKFFPAEDFGGVKTLRSFNGPFPDVRFIPSGGIDKNNLKSYLELPYIFSCSGSWLIDNNAMNRGNYNAIVQTCRESLSLVKQTKEDHS